MPWLAPSVVFFFGLPFIKLFSTNIAQNAIVCKKKLIFFGQRPNTGQRINRRKTYTVNTGTKITALFLVRKITFCPWLEKTPPVCGWKNYFLSLVGKITFCLWSGGLPHTVTGAATSEVDLAKGVGQANVLTINILPTN